MTTSGSSAAMPSSNFSSPSRSSAYWPEWASDASSRANALPGRFDVTAPFNQHKLHAADALARLAEQHGLSLIQLAVGFALNHPSVSSVIIGPRTEEHLTDYLKAADKLFPVIETDGGRVVEILVTKGAVYQGKASKRDTYRGLLRRAGDQARSNDDD